MDQHLKSWMSLERPRQLQTDGNIFISFVYCISFVNEVINIFSDMLFKKKIIFPLNPE